MDSASGTISSSVSGHRILCAIISHAKSPRRDTIRKTWLPLVTPEVDAKFFVGTHDEKLEDEVITLCCNDTHEGIPDKVREICRWALERGYEFMWKVDDDVQLKPSKLADISSPFAAVILPDAAYPGISGFLYGFDRRCMEILSSSPIPVYADGWDCGYYQDEYWVADKLGRAGIPCKLIIECGVLRQSYEKAFPPYWVIAVHGESVAERSITVFKQLNGFELPTKRRLGRTQ